MSSPYAPPPPPQPALEKRRRRWPWVLAAVVAVLFVVGAIVGTGTKPDVSGQIGSVPPAPNTASSVDAEPVVEEPQPEPPAYLKPEVHEGTGDDVVTTTWPEQFGTVTFECATCSGNTVVQTDGPEFLIVNTIGPYEGTKWINVAFGASTKTTTITITANAAWTLTVSDFDKVRRVENGPAQGEGDDVIYLGADSTKAAVSHEGQSNFVVEVVPLDEDGNGGQHQLPVNEIGSYDGTVPLDGPAIVQVTSEGSWTITPSS